jgi:hypothetical protein
VLELLLVAVQHASNDRRIVGPVRCAAVHRFGHQPTTSIA